MHHRPKEASNAPCSPGWFELGAIFLSQPPKLWGHSLFRSFFCLKSHLSLTLENTPDPLDPTASSHLCFQKLCAYFGHFSSSSSLCGDIHSLLSFYYILNSMTELCLHLILHGTSYFNIKSSRQASASTELPSMESTHRGFKILEVEFDSFNHCLRCPPDSTL